MKKDPLFNRPLVPFLLCFAAGILTASALFSAHHTLILLLTISFCLLGSLLSPARLRAYVLLVVFFLTGALLATEKNLTSGLRPIALNQRKAVLEGVVLEPPTKPGPNMMRVKLLAQGLVSEDKITPLNENIVLTVYRYAISLHPGEKIRFPARLRTFKNFRNPGRYDYENAMARAGFTCAAAVSDGRTIVPMGSGELPFFPNLVEKLQSPVRVFFNENLDHRNAALFSALILGEREGIDRHLRETFNISGLGHLLAVSGLHIGLVAWAVFFTVKWGLSRFYRLMLTVDIRKWSALITCFPVIGYTLLAGCRVSSQRAMIMVLAYLLSIILGREKEVWSTLALAGLVILFLDPGAIFTPSFQLSFIAVTGILWLAPPILNKLGSRKNAQPETRFFKGAVFDYVTGLATVSLAAIYFLLPITAFYFHRISVVSLPANLTTIPILGLWVLPSAFLSVLILPFSAHLAALCLGFSTWGLNIMMEIIGSWADLSWASVWVLAPNFFEIVLFYAFTFFAFFVPRKKWARPGLAVVVLLIILDVAFWVHRVKFNRDLEVVFLDVGKGNAALVSFPGGEKMLIDGGGFPGNRFDVGKMVIAPFLWQRKINTIDYLVLSHPQADHMNGLLFIARAFHSREFWHNGDLGESPACNELMKILEANNIAVRKPAQLQEKIHINGAEIEILYPGPEVKTGTTTFEGKDLNNRSMVLRISYGGTSILFPGDLEEPGEKALLAQAGSRVRSNILLSPHHGSRTSSTDPFLKKVSPGVCIISSGEDRFGRFPHPSVLKRLAQVGCEAISISDSGAVTVKVGPDGFDVSTFLSKAP